MKMAEMIAFNSNLLLVLPRFNITLGFGEKSVAEVCEKYHVSSEFLLLVCNIYTFPGYKAETEHLKAADWAFMVPYLKASHRFYTTERLPHIYRHLQHVTARIEPRNAALLDRFFDEYRKEIALHFDNEENNLFPHLERLLAGETGGCSDPQALMEPHENIMDQLNDLMQIVAKYLPDQEVTDELVDLMFCVEQLSNDLARHAEIEEKILMPYLIQLEGGQA